MLTPAIVNGKNLADRCVNRHNATHLRADLRYGVHRIIKRIVQRRRDFKITSLSFATWSISMIWYRGTLIYILRILLLSVMSNLHVIKRLIFLSLPCASNDTCMYLLFLKIWYTHRMTTNDDKHLKHWHQWYIVKIGDRWPLKTIVHHYQTMIHHYHCTSSSNLTHSCKSDRV